MNKTVYGVYTETAEVVQAINSLKAKGYDGSDITVVADKEEKLDLMGNYTIDNDVKTVSNSEDSFMDKVAKFFTFDTNNPVEETMRTDYGFTSEESARYAEEVNNGKVLVLVNKDAQFGDTKGMDRTEDMNIGANASSSLNTSDRVVNKNDVRTGSRVDGSPVNDSVLPEEDENRLGSKSYQKNRIDTDNL